MQEDAKKQMSHIAKILDDEDADYVRLDRRDSLKLKILAMCIALICFGVALCFIIYYR